MLGWLIFCIVFLDRLNENKQYVSYTEFYNDAVNDQLEIKEDFPNFKDKKGYAASDPAIVLWSNNLVSSFSFCDYPFMLNPAVKADVLKVESVFQMRHELQDAFFRALFQGKLVFIWWVRQMIESYFRCQQPIPCTWNTSRSYYIRHFTSGKFDCLKSKGDCHVNI